MANMQMQPSSGKEVAMLVAVLVTVAAATLTTYWVRSGGAETAGKPAVTTAAPAPPSRPHVTAPVPVPIDGAVIHADVYFDFKSTRLRADAVQLLQEKAALMDRSSVWAVLVQGHADRQGPPEYNRTLAQRRAEAVKQFLVELGVFETQIKVITVGQEGSLCDEPSKECQQLNRRVHLEIRKLTRASLLPVRPQLAVGDVLHVGGPITPPSPCC